MVDTRQVRNAAMNEHFLPAFRKWMGPSANGMTDKALMGLAGWSYFSAAFELADSTPHQWTSAMAHAGYEVHGHHDIQCYECGEIYAAMERERIRAKYGAGGKT